jgi:histidinol-phosphate aminotransferase
VKLASNESPWPPLPSIAAAMTAAARDANRYPDHLATELRVRLADRFGVDPAEVAVGAGAVGLLFQLGTAFLDPGDEVVFGWPSFEAYPIVARLAGATAVPVPLRRQTIDGAAIAAAVTERTRLVLLASPNNPTGTALRRVELEHILAAVPDTCLVVADEAYREFVTGADVATGLADRGPNLVVLRTFSKAYGLAGARVGYAIAAPDVVRALDKVLVPFAVNAMAQVGATTALGVDEWDLLEPRIEATVAERARVASRLRTTGWSVPDPQANFVWLPTGAAAVPLAHAMEARGVVTRPFEDVGVRVTIGQPAENDAFLAAFEAAAKEVDAELAWALPIGDQARHAHAWLQQIDAAEARLGALLDAQPTGLTEPDPGGTEQWEAGQVWAHIGEFGHYWLRELRLVLDGPADPTPFGRTKTNPHRIAAIESGRHTEAAQHFDSLRRAFDGLRALLAEMTAEDWARVGRHEKLGDMNVERILQEFLVGHAVEHADQLTALAHG